MSNYDIPHNKQADKAVFFANHCHLNGDYHGQFCKLRPWQEQIYRILFGRVDDNGHRIIKRCLLMLPRKSSKTYMTAQVCLYALLTFGPNQVVLSAAASGEQAQRVFDAMVEILQQDEFLLSLLGGKKAILKSEGRIVNENNHSYYCAVTCGGHGSHGHNPTVVIFDEFHAFLKPVQRETFTALSTGRGSRLEPITIMISTQTSNRYSLAGEEFAYALKVRGRIENGVIRTDGEIDNPNYLAVLYYASPDDDWHDETLWHAVSPALGDFVKLDEYREQHQLACDIPSRSHSFKTLYLNMPSDSDEKWLNLDDVKACYGEISDADLKETKVWCGLDLAPVCDLSCFSMLHEVGDKLYLRVFSWCAEDTIKERTRIEKVPYGNWQKDGFITSTQGNTTDFGVIERDIIQICQGFQVKGFGCDKSYAYDLGQRLINGGLPVKWFVQGFKSFGPAVARTEKLILDKKIVIQKNPVLEYCLSNTRMETDPADNQKPSNRLRARTEKIDASVSTIMAVGMWLEDRIPPKRSVYENPDTQV